MTRPPPLISLRAATFRQTPTSRALFPNTTFTLPSASSPPEKWTILGPSKYAFLSILRGSNLATPPNSRLYPYLAERRKWPYSAIQLVSFGGGSTQGMLKGGTGGDGYISARYETLRETFDQTLNEWLENSLESRFNPYEWDGNQAELEAKEAEERKDNETLLEKVVKELKLEDLRSQAVMTLSNGQSRRARIAQALLKRPELLLLDEPFMGLDPNGHELLSKLLDRISTPGKDASSTPVVLGLRPQDPVPEWSTHILYVDNDAVVSQGEKRDVVSRVNELGKKILLEGEDASEDRGVVERAWAGIGSKASTSGTCETFAEPLVEMENVRIAYFGKVILDDFSWTIRRGEKWGLFGPNGSGKTTITSLLTSDHPLTYSLPIRHFSRPRLPQPGKPGISVFEIQSKIGISSPELHSFFPRHLSLRRCVESGFAETFVSQPKISPQEREHVGTVLEEFKDLILDGDWKVCFGDADMSTQRLALFLRAVAPKRDIVIFDEAFSGMRKEARERCFRFLGTGKGWDEGRQAMVVVSHVSEEVPPGVEKWVRLGEKGGKEKAVFGEL